MGERRNSIILIIEMRVLTYKVLCALCFTGKKIIENKVAFTYPRAKRDNDVGYVYKKIDTKYVLRVYINCKNIRVCMYKRAYLRAGWNAKLGMACDVHLLREQLNLRSERMRNAEANEESP